jgi:hypothetical protein
MQLASGEQLQMKLLKRTLVICFGLLGTAMVIIGIFAYQLHLDNNRAMGPNRILLTSLGAIILLSAIFLLFSSYFRLIAKSSFFQKLYPFFHWLTFPIRWVTASSQEKPESKTTKHRTGWFAAAGAMIAIFLSFWYITSGRMDKWSSSTVFYDRQANAFLAGQLSLLEKPPAALAEIANPYIPANRVGVSGYIWDISYYKGKYFLYWGPVPAIFAAGAKLLNRNWVIEDQFLVIFFVSGLAIVMAGLMNWLQKKYFPKIPGWTVLALTLLGTLNTPIFWLINHPIVHEVPISAGQFFLVLGLFTGIKGLESKNHKILLLALTGCSWGAAIGSRFTLGFGIAWMVFLVCLYLLIKSITSRIPGMPIIALILPLVFWGGGLAWFNFARFGNILETGLRYQLTGGGLPADYRNIASVSYVLPNLYNLLARPFTIDWHAFPFFFTPWIRNNMWPKLIFYPRNPLYFYGEPITGLLASIPASWFLVVASIVSSIRLINKKPRMPFKPINWLQDQNTTIWLGWMAGGAFLLNLGILSFFIASTMRYTADMASLLTILIALFLGWASNTFHDQPRLWTMVLISTGILILVSILVSLFTSFQNGFWISKNGNPQLYQAIAHFFTGK